MTKKLFVVLVLITAMLVSFSLVMAAKKAPRGTFEPFVKPTIGQQQTPTQMPRGSITATLEATNLYPDRGTKAAAATATASAPVDKILAGPLVYTKDFCDLYGAPAYAITDWFWGMEWYANFQNPEEFGCTDVWPFEVIEVGFNIQVDFAMDIDVQGFVYSNAGDLACPVPGAELCQTPIYTVSIPSDGHWILTLPLTEQCCVWDPYFAVVYIFTDLYGSGADAVSEDDLTDVCRSYNDYGAGWEDLVVLYGWPGEMILWSTGYTNPQNTCEEPEEECYMQRDNGAASSYFSSWSVGDQTSMYFDPTTMCPDCDPDYYPFLVDRVEAAFYDFMGVGTVDVIVHFYEAGDICMGPAAEIYSFAATVTTFYTEMASIPVPDQLCLEEDFFVAIEFNSGATGSIPCLLMTDEVADTCVQFNYYGGFWYEWWDFWSPPPPGYNMLRVAGNCAAPECYPGEECYLQQDPGVIAYYFSQFAEGDIAAKYFDPEVYCDPPVYPYRIHDVDFLLYDFGGVGSVNIIIDVDLECSDPCDGPGTMIYQSEPFTITTFYPDMAHVDLPEVICVYEPFFITIEYASGVTGSTPSLLWADEAYPCDTCHAWLWWASGGYPWWTEWHDFWSPPAGGCPIIRVSGYTESPACDIPPCDTTLEYLYGGMTVDYYWKQPPNDQFMNMRFEMPADHGGRLEGFQIAFYEAGSFGTPEPDAYVWFSDGTYPLDNNPPYQAIAEFHTDVIVWFPGYTYFDAYPFNLVFDPGELFHIGGSHAHEADDTLAWLSDAGDPPSYRASAWDGAAWGGYDPYQFIIEAIICPFAPENPTFSMRCTPSVGYATPGDPPVNVYQIEIGAVIGYAENVTLSLLPTGHDISATFAPNGVPPDFVSDVAIAVGAAVPYGSYDLTFQGVGDDAQTKTCGVTLKVQPPYDEDVVEFFHGTQGATNFGALGNDASSQNFEWYGTNALYDGSIISLNATYPWEEWEDHMALDMYDCQHVGFIPTQHMTITDIASCVGMGEYEELYGEMSYSEFYTEEDVISCEWDSLFIIGLRDVECTDFSIKIKIYYNPAGPDIPEMYAGIFEDWDVLGDDWGEMDTVHNMLYQYDPADPNIVFGIMSVPFYDQFNHTMKFIHNPTEVYPDGDSSINCGNDPGPAYLARLMMAPGHRDMGYWTPDPDDHSVLTVSPPFSLNTGEKHIEIWIDFGRNLGDGMTWEQWYKKILRYVGMYRGDVNASDTLDLPSLDVSDLVYLINYLYKEGPAPLPFADQGDVDAKGPYGAIPCDNLDLNCGKNNVDVADLVYLLNYIFKSGPPPVDRVRFIEQCWTRPSLFLNPYWN